jgi:hypothetical protein
MFLQEVEGEQGLPTEADTDQQCGYSCRHAGRGQKMEVVR